MNFEYRKNIPTALRVLYGVQVHNFTDYMKIHTNRKILNFILSNVLTWYNNKSY